MIEVDHISKTYKIARRNAGLGEAVKALWHRQTEKIKALDNISFTIQDGEMIGYIGPNGAGKSSTIKILSGVLTPDSGTCLVNGRIPWKERTAHVKHIGVVFGQRSGLWWDVPVIDSFELLKEIYRIPEAVYRDSLEELVTLLNLENIIKTPTRQLSLGQRMRCEIAAALLHRPDILFLDEPTIGLDAVSKLAVRDFIRRRNAEHGTTIILTTHDMQDIEALTHRILLIGRGRILRDCSFDELKAEVAGGISSDKEKAGTSESVAADKRREEASEGVVLDKRKAEVSEGVVLDKRKAEVSEGVALDKQKTEASESTSPNVDEIVAALYEKYQI